MAVPPQPNWSAARQHYHALYRALGQAQAVPMEGLSASGTSSTGTLSITAPSARSRSMALPPTITVEPEDLAETREATIFLLAYMMGGGWIGSLVHHPALGTVVGLGMGWYHWRPRS